MLGIESASAHVAEQLQQLLASPFKASTAAVSDLDHQMPDSAWIRIPRSTAGLKFWGTDATSMLERRAKVLNMYGFA